MNALRAAVVTCSTRCAAGDREDRSGAVLADGLTALGLEVVSRVVVTDDVAAIADAVRAAVDGGVDVVLTTGGTGLTPSDCTPEAVRPLLTYEVPGIADAVRQAGAVHVPTAVLSRGLAGVIDRTLVVTLPGSPGGVRDGLAVLAPLLDHAVAQLHGGDH